MLRKKLGKPLEDTTTINLIESLSIIQRTPQQNLQINQNLQIPYLLHIIHKSIILQRTSTDNTKPKVAESEIIGANHLGFAKSLFQHYCQYLGLNHNHISAKLAFNFYVNEKISSLLGTPVNTKSAKKTFYKELIQNTNLPTNYNFASIITEINKEIEHHTQQRYLITYTSKDKEKLQTPAKTRVESLSNPSYHYTPKSAINISSTDHLDDSHSKVDKGKQNYFRISDLWEAVESEKEEEKSKNQEFTYQHPITENLEQQLENPEIKTPNIRMPPNQRNQKPELINQQNLRPQLLQLPPQQPGQQQLLQQPPQPPNLDPIAYTPITKLDNFTGEEDDTQIWLNDVEKAITANGWNDAQAIQAIPYFLKDTANSWYQSLINKPQNFNAFKAEFLQYFSNNNSINHLVNAFTTIKQGETKAITTYLGRFHQNLCQIQAIDTNYFTAPQILNQFIHGLCSSILQHVHPLHPGTLQDAVTRAKDFESTESEANHIQAINLVMNRSSELDSKLEKFSKSINKNLHNDTIIKEILIVAKINYVHLYQPINSGNWKRISAIIVINKDISKLTVASEINIETPIAATNLSTANISISDSSATATSNISTAATNHLSTPTNSNTNPKPSLNDIRSAMVVYQLIPSLLNPPSRSHTRHLDTSCIQNPNSQHYLSLLVIPEDATSNNTKSNQHIPTNTIPSATISSNKSLAAIFLFKLEENTPIPLFSRAALKEKPITAMYTDARVDSYPIKLILDSGSAGSIITRQLMDQLGHRRNTSGNCKDSLREDPRQWVDFSSVSEKEYINTHNNQELKNNLHRNSKKKAFSVTVTLSHK
ncbi:hypothetical protein G9A89_017364 [Geosiphon pyriformis]|nr:hypothetical protein G9A89_017364 [Geosiphon pyriformis]